MLKRLYEWYRVVNPSPTDELIRKRREAIVELTGKLNEDFKLAADACSAVIAGFNKNFSERSRLVTIAVECIRDHQPAFPSDLTENALELQMCCAIALGEILSTAEQSELVDLDPDNGSISSLLLSGLGMVPNVQERHLASILKELRDIALAAAEEAAAATRARAALNYKPLEKLATNADMPTFWNGALPIFVGLFQDLERQAAADREELNALWWLYSGTSETFSRSVADLPIGAAVICSGVELAQKVMPPPPNSIRSMVARAVSSHSKKAKITLHDVVKDWEHEVYELMVPSSDSMANVVRSYPTLFPLSWLCLRLHESHGATDWAPEFQRNTCWEPNKSVIPAIVAIQAFNEVIAQRLYRVR